jgi:predicted DNA-binding transcriptional regulator AlpA
MPLRLFADRRRSGAYLARALHLGAMIGFFFTTQLLQTVFGFSALQAGLGFLPMTAINFAVALDIPRLSRRIDAAALLTAGPPQGPLPALLAVPWDGVHSLGYPQIGITGVNFPRLSSETAIGWRWSSTLATTGSPRRMPATTSTDKLTIPQVCAELSVSRSTFYFWRQTGKAPRCIKLPNGEVRVRRSDLDLWLESRQESA